MNAKASINKLDFYKSYQVDYFLYKMLLLKESLKNKDGVVMPSLLEASKELNISLNEDFARMIKLEMHFTYYQIMESLFELIFALESQDDANVWYHITNSKWTKNFDRIEAMAGDIKQFKDYFWKDIEFRGNQETKRMPFIQYVFFYGVRFNDDDGAFKKSLQILGGALMVFAKDFSDRNAYNAYKHSLRLIPYFKNLQVKKHGMTVETDLGDSYTFLHREEKGTSNDPLLQETQVLDPERDIKLSQIAVALIKNIIYSRRACLCKDLTNRPLLCHTLDIDSAAKRNTDVLGVIFKQQLSTENDSTMGVNMTITYRNSDEIKALTSVLV